MTSLEAALLRLDSDLRRLNCRWALVGGIAVSARARPRTTQDVDVAIAVSGDEEAERIVAGLRESGYQVKSTVEQTARGRLATVRLLAPPEQRLPKAARHELPVVVDLLFASSGIEPEVVAHSDRLTITPNVSIPVAAGGHLLALKLLAHQGNRPQDLMDAIALIEVADSRDLELAREATDLIARRGFDRGKDLAAELARALALRPEPE